MIQTLPPSYYCLPDWMETPKDRLTGLRAVIYRRARAKRKRLTQAAQEKRTQDELRIRLGLKGD